GSRSGGSPSMAPAQAQPAADAADAADALPHLRWFRARARQAAALLAVLYYPPEDYAPAAHAAGVASGRLLWERQLDPGARPTLAAIVASALFEPDAVRLVPPLLRVLEAQNLTSEAAIEERLRQVAPEFALLPLSHRPSEDLVFRLRLYVNQGGPISET